MGLSENGAWALADGLGHWVVYFGIREAKNGGLEVILTQLIIL